MGAGEEGEQQRVAGGGEGVEEAVVERCGGRRRREGLEQERGVAEVAGGEHAEEQRLQAALAAAEQARVEPLRFLHLPVGGAPGPPRDPV